MNELELLADEIDSRGGEFVACHIDEWPGEALIRFRPGADETVLGESLAHDEITGAYFQSNVLFHPIPELQKDAFEGRDDFERMLAQIRDHRSVFESLARRLESDGTRVVPRVRNHYLQAQKPWQLSQFEREGVPTPPSLFTNDPETVVDFHRSHERVIYKPTTNGAPPSELTADDLREERLEALASAPVQFQAFVPGEDLRVYVLDGKVVGAIRYESETFSFKIDQEEGKDVGIEGASVSEAVEASAVRAVDAVELRFGAVDVRRRPDGRHVVFEVNETPVFTGADRLCGQNVAGALADYLLDGGAQRPWPK
ncbi:ATP-grasp domain-containing protein [Halorussus amylolyticus]|uniref:ATP-grasp domain-containing protein n=1 Tax=Halorussus amylolyticus TaxID=1126242 RepID=UPI00138F8AFE|nr:ATP-grasp domain-containing protein [Halorussus amylolyticus]